jgi:hypothetical protein
MCKILCALFYNQSKVIINSFTQRVNYMYVLVFVSDYILHPCSEYESKLVVHSFLPSADDKLVCMPSGTWISEYVLHLNSAPEACYFSIWNSNNPLRFLFTFHLCFKSGCSGKLMGFASIHLHEKNIQEEKNRHSEDRQVFFADWKSAVAAVTLPLSRGRK